MKKLSEEMLQANVASEESHVEVTMEGLANWTARARALEAEIEELRAQHEKRHLGATHEVHPNRD